MLTFKKGDDKENEFGKVRLVFNLGKSQKIILGIGVGILVIYLLSIILSKVLDGVQKMFYNNTAVQESITLVMENEEVISKFGDNLELGKIGGSVVSSGGSGTISVYYYINGNITSGKVVLEGHKKGDWIIDSLQVVSGEEYLEIK
ncbi:MAG: hypothetical protein GY828_08305 [Candidatus Gracilibacteria bacterium]|nr:hypothetical protein [Candidatus Gracilibacteria bacterium]